MPGRFAIGAQPDQVGREFGARPAYMFRPSYNIFPGRRIPAIAILNGEKVMEAFTWGISPIWESDSEQRPRRLNEGGKAAFQPLINARSETIEAKRAFREAFLQRRCLIPVSGYYEWKEERWREGDKSRLRSRSGKSPFYITLKERPLFAFAGIWTSGKDFDGKPSMELATITTEPNELVAKIHHRMPAILPKSMEAEWLDPLSKPSQLKAMLKPYPAEKMQAHEVSKLVGNPKNQGPELIKPAKHHLTDFLK